MRKEVIIKVGKIAGIIAVIILFILVTASLVINYSSIQDTILSEAKKSLPEDIRPNVSIDNFRVNLLNFSASIYGIEVTDQKNRKMLQTECVEGQIKFWQLLKGRIVLKAGEIKGVKAFLTKSSKETPANYQFILDAFKKDSKNKQKKNTKKSSAKRFAVDIEHAELQDINVRYDHYSIKLTRAKYIKNRIGNHIAILENGLATWEGKTKKGKVTNQIGFGNITGTYKKNGEKLFSLNRLTYKTDNHLPRKNRDKPKRGYFDIGHLDLESSMDLVLNHIDKDSMNLTVVKGTLKDSITGFNFTKMNMEVAANKKRIFIKDVFLKHINTFIKIPEGEIILPDKEKGSSLRYYARTVTGKTILQDIARPFAPVLKNFTIPLRFKLRFSGTDQAMEFRNIRVGTDDKKVSIAGTGLLRNLKQKEELMLHFDITDMVVKPGIKDKIINQFPVKKFMMRQLYTLGTIRYHGDFDILWKKEIFRGLLNTEIGNINFQFTIDNKEKYLSGNVSTKDVVLGKLFEIKDLGIIDCSADFKFDISKPRTAIIRKKVGGKLPIGEIQAQVNDCSFNESHFRNVFANIKSDGALANGDVELRGNHAALVVNFSFTNTEQMSKMKIKPGIKFREAAKQDAVSAQ